MQANQTQRDAEQDGVLPSIPIFPAAHGQIDGERCDRDGRRVIGEIAVDQHELGKRRERGERPDTFHGPRGNQNSQREIGNISVTGNRPTAKSRPSSSVESGSVRRAALARPASARPDTLGVSS